MDKKQLYHIIEWSVAVAACIFLIWKIATYEDYATLWATLRGMDAAHLCALAICVALMPVNMALEAWRWMTLMNGASDGVRCTVYGVRLSFREAHRQVYYSKLAGIITPWRLGEYPARGVLMSERVNELTNEGVWGKVLSMGAIGSATMTAAIIIAGVAAMMVYGVRCTVYGIEALDTLDALGGLGWSYYAIVGALMVVLGVGLWFAPRLLQRWAAVSHRLVLISLGQSLARLLCWCVQLGLVIWALGGIEALDILDVLEVLGKTVVYYLFVTITPNVPIVEVGVRGAWAILVFGTMNAALAGVLLWGINTLLPCLVWPFMRKSTSKITQN